MSFRIEERLTQQLQEVDSLRKEARRVNTLIKGLQDKDLLSPEEKDNLEQFEIELLALQKLVTRINNKDALQFFTDEGLIPNYAFPEQGVLLRSVIYRSRKDNDWRRAKRAPVPNPSSGSMNMKGRPPPRCPSLRR